MLCVGTGAQARTRRSPWNFELWLDEDEDPLIGVLRSRQARRAFVLRLHQTDPPTGLSKATAFKQFIRQSPRLHEVVVHMRSSTVAPSTESALCASLQLSKYTARGFVPQQLPACIRSLDVEAGPELESDTLEALLRRAQHCAELSSITFGLPEMYGGACDLCYCLRASELEGLHLPRLSRLPLELYAFELGGIAVSWLAQPRSFRLHLRLEDTGAAYSQDRLDVLGTLPGLLQPTDSLTLALAEDSEALSVDEQLALAQLSLFAFKLWVPACTRLCHLPKTKSQEVHFLGSAGKLVKLDWTAIASVPCYYQVFLYDLPLQVLGRPGSPPDSAEGWALDLRTDSTVTGLPPMQLHAPSRTYELLNQAAVDNPELLYGDCRVLSSLPEIALLLLL